MLTLHSMCRYARAKRSSDFQDQSGTTCMVSLLSFLVSRIQPDRKEWMCGKPPRKWLRETLSSRCIETSLVALATIVTAFRSSQTLSFEICYLGYLAQLLCSYLYELLSRLPHQQHPFHQLGENDSHIVAACTVRRHGRSRHDPAWRGCFQLLCSNTPDLDQG
jgi:hypothetical protein